MIEFEDLEKLIGKKASAVEKSVPEFELDDDGEEYQGVGVDGLLASTEKLLAINRGLVDTDERDSMKFQKILTRPALFRERIKMDSGKLARTAMYRVAKMKNLNGIQPGYFNGYIDSVLIGNPLTSPLEEINPMQLVENSRRITRMGPGGLSSSDSITEDSQAVHPSQFGFISPIEGPESERAGIDVRMALGTRIGSNGRIYQKMFDRRKNTFRWMSPEDLDGLVVKLPD
jgi:DNA-directed RNA polymerase beta subunit